MILIRGFAATFVVAWALIACDRDSSSNAGSSTALAADAAVAAPPPSVPMNVTPVPTTSVEAMVNPEHAPPYAGPTGVVEGTIYVTGPAAPPMMGKSYNKCPAAAKMYATTFRSGAALPDGRRPLADVVVAITGYDGFINEKSPAQRIEIRDCAYSARTVALTLGQRIEVANKSTGFMFAPALENQPAPAIMMATPNGDPVKLYPKRPGRYRIVDKGGNDWMEADVYVIGQPLHAVSDENGHYRIEGVPVGKLKLGARHPFISGDVQVDVDVQSSTVMKADVTIPYTKDEPRPPSIPEQPQLP